MYDEYRLNLKPAATTNQKRVAATAKLATEDSNETVTATPTNSQHKSNDYKNGNRHRYLRRNSLISMVTGDIDDPQPVTATNPQPTTATTRDRRHRRTRDVKATTTKTVTSDMDDPQSMTTTNSQSATAANAQRTAKSIEQ